MPAEVMVVLETIDCLVSGLNRTKQQLLERWSGGRDVAVRAQAALIKGKGKASSSSSSSKQAEPESAFYLLCFALPVALGGQRDSGSDDPTKQQTATTNRAASITSALCL